MKILVVDDDREFCGTLEKILTKKGHKIKCVHDPMDALKIKKGREFDLILLDHRMAPITGVDLLEKLRNEGIKTPAIMMSAYASRDTFYETRKLGLVDHINKPFSIQALEVMIAETEKKQKRGL
ncbi:response regulator [Candidatus Auribacterota bacterium]